jgi:hypothetical protein
MAGNRFRDFSDVGPSVDGLFDRELRAENDASGNAIYVGYAKAGSATSDAAWLIKKNTYDANDSVTRSQIANDNLSFSHVWDDRASLF